MIRMASKTRLVTGFISSLGAVVAAPAAQAALIPPPAITIDGGPFGPMEVNVGVDGFGYVTSNTPRGTKSNGFQLGTALVNIATTTGLVRGTVTIGDYSGLILGYAPGSATSGGQNYTPFSPLYNGYISIVPNDHIKFSAGQFGTPEGFESAQDWNDYSIFHSEIAYVEQGQSRGVNTVIDEGPINAVVQFDDGFYSKRFNYLQWLVTYTINPTFSITVNGGSHLSVTGPNVPGNLLYNNSALYGGWITYSIGNFTVTPEVQYVYTNPVRKYAASTVITKTAGNLTSGIFADYVFSNTPYSLGGFVEYATEKSAHADGSAGDFFGFGPCSSLWGGAITPTWEYKYLFARTDLAFVHVNNGDGSGVKAQFAAILEGGLLF